jgi:hypothetical protein
VLNSNIFCEQGFARIEGLFMKNKNLALNEICGGLYCFVRGVAVSFVLFAALFALLSGCSGAENGASEGVSQRDFDRLVQENNRLQRELDALRGEGQNAPPQQRQQQQPQGVNIDGRWERGDNDRRVELVELVFDGDSISEYRYVRIFAENEISQADLDSGSFTAWQECINSDRGFVGDIQWSASEVGVRREIVSVEPWVAIHERVSVDGKWTAVEDLDWVAILVRERRGGTVAFVPEGRDMYIEILWENTARGENGWERVGFERTVNALAPDKLRIRHLYYTFVE